MKHALFALAIAIAGIGSAAAGQTTSEQLAPALAARIAALGGQTKILTAGDERVVEVTVPAGRFYLGSRSCPVQAECRSIDLWVTLKPSRPMPASAVADWNAHQRFAKASLGPAGEPELGMTAILSKEPGLEPFDAVYRVWTDALRRFVALAYGPRPRSGPAPRP